MDLPARLGISDSRLAHDAHPSDRDWLELRYFALDPTLTGGVKGDDIGDAYRMAAYAHTDPTTGIVRTYYRVERRAHNGWRAYVIGLRGSDTSMCATWADALADALTYLRKYTPTPTPVFDSAWHAITLAAHSAITRIPQEG